MIKPRYYINVDIRCKKMTGSIPKKEAHMYPGRLMGCIIEDMRGERLAELMTRENLIEIRGTKPPYICKVSPLLAAEAHAGKYVQGRFIATERKWVQPPGEEMIIDCEKMSAI